MSVETKILSLTQKITHAINSVQGTVGDISSLPTIDKANIVASLVELKNLIDSVNTSQQNIVKDTVTDSTHTWSSHKIDQEIVQAIADLIDGAPEWLNSLKELASALQNDPDIINSLTGMVNKRVAVDQAQAFSSPEKAQGRANIDAASNAALSSLQSDLNAGLNTKQDSLVSGTNIKSVNSQSIVGSGNITVSLPSKSGVISFGSFSGNPKKATITFTTPFLDTNYSVSIISTDSRSWSIESITNGGFVINANANADLNSNVYWNAVKHGEV